MGTGEVVRYERDEDGIAVITLNRPEVLNAFNSEMLARLRTVLAEFDQDDAASVAIVTGSGRAFSSGADRKELASGGMLQDSQSSQTLLYAAKNWKPVIAAVHGFVLGMALELVFQSEFVIAGESTRFQVTETRHGVSTGPIWPIIQLRGGLSFSNYVCLTGEMFGAREAAASNLVSRVVPDDEVMAEALRVAGLLIRLPQDGLRGSVRVARWYMEQHQRHSLPFYEADRARTRQVWSAGGVSA
jgi:enoyl-CoA hydratase/carnithine racemase